jgi:hypothetical protein
MEYYNRKASIIALACTIAFIAVQWVNFWIEAQATTAIRDPESQQWDMAFLFVFSTVMTGIVAVPAVLYFWFWRPNFLDTERQRFIDRQLPKFFGRFVITQLVLAMFMFNMPAIGIFAFL